MNKQSTTFKKNTQYDGMESLFTKITQEDFVKLAVESSYFFEPFLVKERHQEIVDAIKRHDILFVRKTRRKEIGDSNYFEDPTTNYRQRIEHDAFGNNEVIKLIKNNTGYVVARVKTNFPNYVISHIWGEAKDPRYFTSFWNLVLIPAWANHLMDKKDNTGNVGTKLKNTIMAACHKLYQMKSLDWQGMKIKNAPTFDKLSVLHGLYSINVIEKRVDDLKVSSILKKKIDI